MERPTLLIAYGNYGRHVLYDLLANTAIRDLLRLQDSPDLSGKKHIPGLQIFHIIGHDASPEIEARDEQTFKDLYRQIKKYVIADWEHGAGAVIKDIGGSVEYLLSPANLYNEEGKSPVCLDIFFVAAPQSDKIPLHILNAFLQKILLQLNSITAFKNHVQSAPSLHCIQILDYEGLAIEEGKKERDALNSAQQQWKSQRTPHPTMGVDRIYICDSSSKGGIRDSFQRRWETVLFLQFLLFEKVRESDARILYESKPDESIMTSFAIRLGELGLEPLSKVAATKFLEARFRYLCGVEYGTHLGKSHASHLHEQTKGALDSIQLETIQQSIDLQGLKKKVEGKFMALLAPVHHSMSQCSLEANLSKIDTLLQQTREEAAQTVVDELTRIRREQIETMKEKLKKAISHDLSQPVPLGILQQLIIDKIAVLSQELTAFCSPAEEATNSSTDLSFFKKQYSKYAAFKKQQIDPLKNRWVWPFFSIVLCLALTPSAQAVLKHIPPSPSLPGTLLSVQINHPVITFLLLCLPLFLLLRMMGPKYTATSLGQSMRWFVHPAQGRFFHALNHINKNNTLYRKTVNDISRIIVEEVNQVLYELHALLEKRRRETEWLVAQFGHIRQKIPLRKNGQKWDGSSYGHSFTTEDDLTKMQALLPVEASRYQGSDEEYAENIPSLYQDWEQEFSSPVALTPLAFVDRLGAYYHQKSENTLRPDEQNQQTEEFLNFLQNTSSAFHTGYQNTHGTSDYKSFAFTHAKYAAKYHNLDATLRDVLAIDHTEELESSNRIYLVKAEFNIQLPTT